MRFNKQWLFVAVILCWANVAVAATIYVSQGESIQAAIDAAEDGDVVLVADGTYYESDLGWDASDTHITVKSENGPEKCIIDGGEKIINGGGEGSVFSFNGTNQNETDVIDGFTIKIKRINKRLTYTLPLTDTLLYFLQGFLLYLLYLMINF